MAQGLFRSIPMRVISMWVLAIRSSVLRLSLLASSVVLLAGCGSSGLPADAAAVQGVVTYKGQTVDGAVVVFRSESGFAAVGKTDEAGAYKLSSTTIPGGTQPGQYKITVSKREASTVKPLTEEDPNYRPNQPLASQQQKHLLPEKYSRANATDLKADIVAGENTVNLELLP